MLENYWLENGSTISLDNQDLLSALIIDLYNAENIGNLVNVKNLNIDLATDKTTTSTTFVDMSGAVVGFTPTKANCEVTVFNLDIKHSNVGEVQARIRLNHGTLAQETIAVMSGSTLKTMAMSAKYTGMSIGTSTNVQVQWSVSGGTGTAEADTWLSVQIIEYD